MQKVATYAVQISNPSQSSDFPPHQHHFASQCPRFGVHILTPTNICYTLNKQLMEVGQTGIKNESHLVKVSFDKCRLIVTNFHQDFVGNCWKFVSKGGGGSYSLSGPSIVDSCSEFLCKCDSKTIVFNCSIFIIFP